MKEVVITTVVLEDNLIPYEDGVGWEEFNLYSSKLKDAGFDHSQSQMGKNFKFFERSFKGSVKEIEDLTFVKEVTQKVESTWSYATDFIKPLKGERDEDHKKRALKITADRLRVLAEIVENEGFSVRNMALMDLEMSEKDIGEDIIFNMKISVSSPWGG